MILCTKGLAGEGVSRPDPAAVVIKHDVKCRHASHDVQTYDLALTFRRRDNRRRRPHRVISAQVVRAADCAKLASILQNWSES